MAISERERVERYWPREAIESMKAHFWGSPPPSPKPSKPTIECLPGGCLLYRLPMRGKGSRAPWPTPAH
jgi:hypothetical protein